MGNGPARLCFAGWPIISSPSLAGWPMASRPVLRWLVHLRHSLPCWLADDCSPVHHWLAHSDQSHPCQLASGCSACASLAGPSQSVPPLPAGRCGCSPVYHCWPMVTSPTLASWPIVLRWLTDRPGCLYFTGWPIILPPLLARLMGSLVSL